ncbi:hypothetical protein F383_18225 [Gossypium arboreum]|uniref:Uncharacterized protein n=1 Tax=Gossypium arboreum TaxID=29729 RepID=A0A0B0NL55_GOSAR|nr:hypothetical protein F383_18225 [Gossypium arboreum]
MVGPWNFCNRVRPCLGHGIGIVM